MIHQAAEDREHDQPTKNIAENWPALTSAVRRSPGKIYFSETKNSSTATDKMVLNITGTISGGNYRLFSRSVGCGGFFMI